ncbi:MAG TPA: hypothetical protein VGX03_37130 [Candidatus Binatia bacterium]|jgi:hypothetical protein|nr:hypothetical protein [Candidatus Binatia bacterium]
MKTLYPLFLLSILLFGACSYMASSKKVECCENKAACCYGQICCLPRYAKAAGVEPKVFTPEVPVYGAWQDLTPPPGAVIIKRGWLARHNPFGSSEEEQKPQEQPQAQSQAQPQDQQAQQDTGKEEQKEDKGFLGQLWPF